MKIIYILIIALAFISCKKEIVQDLELPQHLLVKDIYLNCDAYDPAENDFITFTLNNKTNCIRVDKPSSNSSACFIKSTSLGGSQIWYEFLLCGYNHVLSQETELLIYLSKDQFQNNITGLTPGVYSFHQKGDPIDENANVFRMRLLPVSESYKNANFSAFSLFKSNSFESDLAVQDNDSYIRIAEIEEFQEGSANFTRFHLEFSCALQDHLGRKIFIHNGKAAITFSLN